MRWVKVNVKKTLEISTWWITLWCSSDTSLYFLVHFLLAWYVNTHALWVQLPSCWEKDTFYPRPNCGIQARAVHIWCISLCPFNCTFWGDIPSIFLNPSPAVSFLVFVLSVTFVLENMLYKISGVAWGRVCTSKKCQWFKLWHPRQCPTACSSTPYTMGDCCWWLFDSFSAAICNW